MIKDIILPSLGEGITEGTVISLLIQEGEQVDVHQSIIDVETDKVALEVPIEYSGIVEEILVAEGDVIEVGQVVAKIKVSSDAEIDLNDNSEAQKSAIEESIEEIIIHEETLEKAEDTVEIQITSTNKDKNFRASPLARKLARELGISIETIKYDGSRVTVQDVKTFVKNRNTERVVSPSSNNNISIQKQLPDFSKWGITKREKLNGMGKATLKNMQYSWSTIPHAWISEKVDITDLEVSRQKHKAQVKQAGGSLTITSLLVKACTIALQKYPIFNSSLDVTSNEIIFKDFINIGVAVDTERGLIVPVIKNTHQKNITEISQDLTLLSQNAKSRKTKIEDLEGATFTISNLGGIGSTGIMPIVNSPEVGILGVGASAYEAKWDGNAFKPRLIAPITIAFDHRIINGADALRFLMTIKSLLEDPFLMIL